MNTHARIWYHFFNCEFHNKELLGCIADEGYELEKFDSCHERFPGKGIVFFNGWADRLMHFLRKNSHNGVARIIAVAVDDKVLGKCDPWKLLCSGASDIFAYEDPRITGKKIVLRFHRWSVVEQLSDLEMVKNSLIGQSHTWKSVIRDVIEIARFTDSSILISGESGTGKELIARLIHTLDNRNKQNPLIVLDCTTIMPELAGSEFFGHERGAFTGAVSARDGAFALANEGTLFLDEISELPLSLQSQLLRVIQEHTFKPVGGNTWYKTKFRLICATNKDLLEQVRKGEFRSDLYYRIADWTCKLPPLRNRDEKDILLLARHFIKQHTPDHLPDIDTAVCKYLIEREYPGNVRDLKQLVSRIMLRYTGGGLITVGDIPEEERPRDMSDLQSTPVKDLEKAVRKLVSLEFGLKQIRNTIEDIAIRSAINEETGNIKRAARRLGITERALQMRRAIDRNKLKVIQGN